MQMHTYRRELVDFDAPDASGAVCAGHRAVDRRRSAGAALVDVRDELPERRERGQRVLIVVEYCYVQEADSVIEPDGKVTQSCGLLFGELGEHRLDQLFVLVGGLRAGGVADNGGLAHDVFPRGWIERIWLLRALWVSSASPSSSSSGGRHMPKRPR